ncbi:NLR family CARD domain-containing protein 3-like isoform X1 [Montipora capricornis]|uniref:NLR family CARD domain-containing protein 3-like isoform X1 n=2 Tax=Montipora capricornis TaxID=246305 RepID=UPI0035F1222F
MATAASTGSSHLGVTDNQKRWLVAGIALNKILIPQIRPSVQQGINTEYNKLKTSHNIHGQSSSGRLQRWPARKLLKYENINGNDVHPRLPNGRFNYSLFDCRVTCDVDFARLYVENYMAKFTAFDDHCDASAVLSLLGWVPAFSSAIQIAAGDVRKARNDWAHCVFSKWDPAKFQQSFIEMDHLVRSMTLPLSDVRNLLGELSDWETKGTQLCMNSPVDPALLQLVQQEVKSLHDSVDNMSLKFEAEKVKISHELGNIAISLEEMNRRLHRLETRQQSLECRADLADGRMDEFEEKMKDLTNSKVPDITMSCQEIPIETPVCPQQLADIIRRDYKGAVLCPFPWCEDDLQLKLSKIFTRLKIVSKEKERARLTDKVVQMTDAFMPHEECEDPRVVLIEGQPGMGKTTYCQKLAYDWSVENISVEGSFPPVKMLLLLKCRDMKTADIEEAIDDQLLPLDADKKEKENFFHFIRCNQSKILLVLDGLDELPENLLKGLFPLIQRRIFANTYVILTARHEAGMRVRRHCDTLLEIVGFTKEDADSYITKYFSNHEDPSLAAKLIKKLDREKELRELSSNPLNTALLCLLCEDTKGAFPSNQTKLYDQLASCAIRRYFARQGIPMDSKDPLKTFSGNLNHLGKVAFEALKVDRVYFSEDEMDCQSVDFLPLCFLSREASVSKLRPISCFSFTHKTFQEYFAAYHLAQEILSGDKYSAVAQLAHLNPVYKYWQLWKFLLTMVVSKSGDDAALVISGLCDAFRSQPIEEEDEQESDDEFEVDADNDQDFDICDDFLNVFPGIRQWFRWWLTEDERTRAATLESVLNLISESEGGDNELTDAQKKMVQTLAMSFPIHKLVTLSDGTGMPRNMPTLFEYLKSNCTLTLFSWHHTCTEALDEAVERVLRANCALKILDVMSISFNAMFWEQRNTHARLTAVLARALCSNCTLTHLNLRCRAICSPGASEIAKALQSNDTLTHLNLEGNYIDNSGAEDLARALQSSCALKYLDLSHNEIGDPGAVALAKALESNRTLTYLDLGHLDVPGDRFLETYFLLRGVEVRRKRIGDAGAAAFAQTLRSNSVLARLNLQNHRISNTGAAAIGESLKSNCTLTHLTLRGNRIEGFGVATLGHAVQVNRGLVNLDLRGNHLMESEAQASFAQGLRVNFVLTHLNMTNTYIGTPAVIVLAESLQSNSSLTILDLYCKKIDSSVAVSLARTLRTNSTLSHLNLRFNLIGDSGAAEFVETLQTNNTLIFLDVRNNSIHEAGAKKIHGFLRALYNMRRSQSSRRTILYNWS